MPAPVLPDGTRAELRCIRCGGALSSAGNGSSWACPAGHHYPVVAGVVDCRPPLRGFDVEADRHLALELDRDRSSSFEELLRHYWGHQQVAAPLVDRFVAGDLIGEERAMEVADQIEGLRGSSLSARDVVLEVGCGTAALGAVLARRSRVVVSDISLAWLVLARRRLAAAGNDDVTVVAASGDHLPFAPETFDLVVGADVVEHVPSASAFVHSCYALLKPGAVLWLSTPNRFSLTPEPHVRIWGLGFLPRRLAPPLVRMLRGTRYDDVKVLSAFELRRTLANTGGHVQLVAPAIPKALRRRYGAGARGLIDVYGLCRGLPFVRHLLLLVSPLFHASVRRGGPPQC